MMGPMELPLLPQEGSQLLMNLGFNHMIFGVKDSTNIVTQEAWSRKKALLRAPHLSQVRTYIE
jgi:hypothetical protein